MIACVCGHSIEEHEDGRGSCDGETTHNGGVEGCYCIYYEEDDSDAGGSDE